MAIPEAAPEEDYSWQDEQKVEKHSSNGKSCSPPREFDTGQVYVLVDDAVDEDV